MHTRRRLRPSNRRRVTSEPSIASTLGAQLQDVLKLQQIAARDVREQVLQELREQIRADARGVFADLLKLLKQVEQQNIKLLPRSEPLPLTPVSQGLAREN